MKIVDELINELSSSKTLPEIFIKAKVLAHRLNLVEFKKWIDHELNGYPSAQAIPDYRKLRCRVTGSISDGRSRYNNYPLPLPDEMRDEMMTWRVTQGIASLDNIEGEAGSFTHPLPPQMYAYLSEMLSDDYVVEFARREVDITQIHGIKMSVKSKLLDFLLNLSDEVKDEGSNMPQNKPDDIKEMFNNAVFGDNITINLGGMHNVQNVENKKIMKGSFDIVREELKRKGVGDQEIEELKQIIESEKPNHETKQPGVKVQGWMNKMFMKAVQGTWTIGAGAAGKVIADAIASYYGW